MSSGISIGSPAITNQELSQARSAQAARVLSNTSKTNDDAKIDKAARDFESILLGEWLEKAEKSFATVPGGDPSEDADPGHDQLQSIGCQFLSEALSKAGGIGLAAMISKHLKAAHAAEAAKREGDESNPVTSANPALHGPQVLE
jgi:Rod binding domain-containing protein